MPDVIACPDPTCRAPARIVDRWTWSSTSGPVEHVKTGCERGHWFTPTVDSLDLPPAPTIAGPSPVSVPVDWAGLRLAPPSAASQARAGCHVG